MNYYPHHIGDFNNSTRHLTRLERCVYRDLIELYYDTESPLSLDKKALCRKIIARTEEEATAVEQVLNEFFTETEQGWHHERCEKEIAKYHGYVESKAAAGRASAAKRANKSPLTQQTLNNSSTGVEQALNKCSTNQEPITSNHKPVTINQEDSKPQKPKTLKADASRGSRLPTDWHLPKLWGEWAIEERKDLTADDVRKIAASFKDHWISQPSRHGVKADWEATWRNWIRKERPRTAVSFADRKAREKEESQAALDAWARGESKSTFIEGEFGRA